MHPVLIGVIVGGVLIIPIILFYLMERANKKKRQNILDNGTTVYAFIVQANSEAFSTNFYETPAQIVFSFAADTPELREQINDIGARMAELKSGYAGDEVRRSVARLVKDEKYRPERRDPLPPEFTGGLDVYAASVAIRQPYLPDGYLTRPYILCKAIPGEAGEVVMIRYPDFPAGSKRK